MKWADSSRLGRPYAKDPSVVRFKDRYLLYFSLPGPDPAGPGWSVGIAESRDLTHWTKVGELLPQHPYEAKGLAAPGARVIDNQVHLFYQTYGNGPRDAICHAQSTDGIHFTRNPENPIFRPSGAWNAGRAIDADVVFFNNRWFLYAATRDPAMKIQMLTGAVAQPGRGFGPAAWTQLGSGPILKPELPWERDCIEAPSLLVRGKSLYMFYAGGYNNAPQQIGCARSSDGLHFTRISTQPLLPNGPPGSWNSSESGHPGVFEDERGQTHLFFQANNDNGRTWFLSRVPVHWRGETPVVAAPPL